MKLGSIAFNEDAEFYVVDKAIKYFDNIENYINYTIQSSDALLHELSGVRVIDTDIQFLEEEVALSMLIADPSSFVLWPYDNKI